MDSCSDQKRFNKGNLELGDQDRSQPNLVQRPVAWTVAQLLRHTSPDEPVC
jgi:hypothetical protein